VVWNGIPLSKIHVSERLLGQKDGSMLESLKRLNGGTVHLPSRVKDRPDRDRLALRFERFKGVTVTHEVISVGCHFDFIAQDRVRTRVSRRLDKTGKRDVMAGLRDSSIPRDPVSPLIRLYCRISSAFGDGAPP